MSSSSVCSKRTAGFGSSDTTQCCLHLGCLAHLLWRLLLKIASVSSEVLVISLGILHCNFYLTPVSFVSLLFHSCLFLLSLALSPSMESALFYPFAYSSCAELVHPTPSVPVSTVSVIFLLSRLVSFSHLASLCLMFFANVSSIPPVSSSWLPAGFPPDPSTALRHGKMLSARSSSVVRIPWAGPCPPVLQQGWAGGKDTAENFLLLHCLAHLCLFERLCAVREQLPKGSLLSSPQNRERCTLDQGSCPALNDTSEGARVAVEEEGDVWFGAGLRKGVELRQGSDLYRSATPVGTQK